MRLLSRNKLRPRTAPTRRSWRRSRPTRRRSFVLDGEVVAFAGAQTSFARLQQRGERRRARSFLYAFDLLHLAGDDTTALPLRARRRLLRGAVALPRAAAADAAAASATASACSAEACRKGWEGLIAKRADAPYTHGRSRDWLKFKCTAEQELVIGGYTAPRGQPHRPRRAAARPLRRTGGCATPARSARASRSRDAAPTWRRGSRRCAARRRRSPTTSASRDVDLGRAAARGAGRLHGVDARRPAAPSALPRAARRQGRRRGRARDAARRSVGLDRQRDGEPEAGDPDPRSRSAVAGSPGGRSRGLVPPAGQP